MLSYAASIGWQVRVDARVVPNCFPHTAAEVAHREGPVQELVFFGRLEQRKGLKLFLEVAKSLPPQVSVAFLGKEVPIDGVNSGELIQRALAGRAYAVHTNLDRDQALEYLSAPHRVAVIPSLTENFPFTVLECATKGIPFLAANVGGIPEIVSDPQLRGKLLFEPNPRSLAPRLEEYLASDAATRRRYVQRMLDLCDYRHNHAAVCQAYSEMLPKAQPVLAQTSARRMADVDKHRTAANDSRVTERPLVSLVVPFYNLGDYLPEALASLAAQDYPHTEVIVVDDGSTDLESLHVLECMKREYPTYRFVRQHNQGLGAARNAGLAAARGEFFLPLDADNIARPDMVSRFVNALERNPSVSAVTCYFLAFTDTPDIAAEQYAYAYRPCGGPFVAAALRNVYGDANGMFRTAALRAIGGYETDKDTTCEDWEMYVKLARTGHQIDVVPDYLFYYRHRETSLLRTTDHVLNRRRVLRQFFSADGLPRAEQIQLWSALAGFDERHRYQPTAQPIFVKKRRSTAYRIAREVKRVIRQAPYYYTISGTIKQLKQRAA
jgi:glycosyltransferase involved in cell wall biosynthesis